MLLLLYQVLLALLFGGLASGRNVEQEVHADPRETAFHLVLKAR